MSKHGTDGRYKAGCRCDQCREWKSAVDRLDYQRHGDRRREAARADYRKRHVADPERVNALALERVNRMRARHPLYATWNTMKNRCTNPNATSFANYGGRGIQVCEDWLDFKRFEGYILSHLGPRPDGLTLDRIDNDGNYEPGNVRWLSRKGQIANRRRVA